MGTVLDEVEYLVRSEPRIEAIAALADGPHGRSDLRAITGASSSTIGRMLRTFESREWTVRDGHHYRATPAGRFVAGEVTALLDRMETERKLQDVAQWLPTEKLGTSIEAFSEAVITVATDEDPYRPVRRYDDLIEDAETMRAFGTTTLKSANAGSLFRNVRAGMEPKSSTRPRSSRPFWIGHPKPPTKGSRAEISRSCYTTAFRADSPCSIPASRSPATTRTPACYGLSSTPTSRRYASGHPAVRVLP